MTLRPSEMGNPYYQRSPTRAEAERAETLQTKQTNADSRGPWKSLPTMQTKSLCKTNHPWTARRGAQLTPQLVKVIEQKNLGGQPERTRAGTSGMPDDVLGGAFGGA